MTMVKKAIETLANVSISLQFFLWCITFICPVLNSYYKIFSNGYILAIYILSIVLTLIILLSKALYGFVYPKPVFVFSLEKSIDAIFVVIVVATFIAFNWMTEKAVQIDSYNPDYGGLFGGVISGISTLLLVKFTLSMQRRVEIQTRKRSANALYTIFSMIEDQLSVLNPTSPEKVIYDASYDYYYKILASEIHFVDRINSFICEGKTEDLKVLMKNRVEYWQYFTFI